jgi:hypothetical protein
VTFLVDHQLLAFFRERGHEGEHLLESGMASSSDAEVYPSRKPPHQGSCGRAKSTMVEIIRCFEAGDRIVEIR